MTDPNASIAVSGLTKHFPGVLAVDRLSFSAAPGEIFGLVGPDGAGKTTTLRMLAGVLPPDRGWARVAGCDVVDDPEGVKNHISYMPQRFGLYDDLFGVTRRHREQRAARLLTASGARLRSLWRKRQRSSWKDGHGSTPTCAAAGSSFPASSGA